jgi:hypothetical protein
MKQELFLPRAPFPLLRLWRGQAAAQRAKRLDARSRAAAHFAIAQVVLLALLLLNSVVTSSASSAGLLYPVRVLMGCIGWGALITSVTCALRYVLAGACEAAERTS